MTQAQSARQEAGTRKPPPPPRAGQIRLTGRGGVAALVAACFLGLLLTAWTSWSAFGDVVFVMACGLVGCFTRADGLRHVVVCPPLAFFIATVAVAALTVPGTLLAAETALVTLGSSAPWLFTGTILMGLIAFGRGYRPAVASRPWVRRLAGRRRDGVNRR